MAKQIVFNNFGILMLACDKNYKSFLETRYYIETSAIRVLHSQLTKVSPLSFTSALTIFELIAGMESDFNFRKTVLSNIKKSGINIDWRMPTVVMVSAFPDLKFKEELTGSLRAIFNLIPESNDLETLHTATNDLTHNLDYFIKYDKQTNDDFKSVLGDRFSEFKEMKKLGPTKFLPKSNETILIELIKFFDSNLSPAQITSLAKSYNGTIDTFITYISSYLGEKVRGFYQPKHNDWNDIMHIVYLTNNASCKLVTNDNGLLNKLNSIWPKKSLNTDTFKLEMQL